MGEEGDIVGIYASSMLVGTLDWESYADGPFMGLGMHEESHQQLILLCGHPSNCSPGKMFPHFLLWVECHGGWLEINFQKQNGIQELPSLHILILKMEASCTSVMSATLLITTWC
jgi:hypothetical protein